MHRLRILAVVVLMCVAALAGCTDDNPKKAASTPSSSRSSSPSESSSSASPSPSDTPSNTTNSASPTAPPSDSEGPNFPRDRTEAASLHVAYLESSVAKTAQEKAVVSAWMTYWQGAADAYYLWKPSDQFLGVARGTAKSDVLDYASRLKADKHRVAGWAKDNVVQVTVKNDTATVKDCTENYTYTVDSEMEHLTRVVPFYEARGTFKKENSKWTVTSQVSKDRNKSCLT
jgi:hypothetical protein